MPDNWEGYDLAVESGNGLVRISVKTRSETKAWKKGNWFNFDDRKECDWIVFIFKKKDGDLRSWVIPYLVALKHANKPGRNRIDPWFRDIMWWKLVEEPLSLYENNWIMNKDI